jgi:hypothetical protein
VSGSGSLAGRDCWTRGCPYFVIAGVSRGSIWDKSWGCVRGSGRRRARRS